MEQIKYESYFLEFFMFNIIRLKPKKKKKGERTFVLYKLPIYDSTYSTISYFPRCNFVKIFTDDSTIRIYDSCL